MHALSPRESPIENILIFNQNPLRCTVTYEIYHSKHGCSGTPLQNGLCGCNLAYFGSNSLILRTIYNKF